MYLSETKRDWSLHTAWMHHWWTHSDTAVDISERSVNERYEEISGYIAWNPVLLVRLDHCA